MKNQTNMNIIENITKEEKKIWSSKIEGMKSPISEKEFPPLSRPQTRKEMEDIRKKMHTPPPRPVTPPTYKRLRAFDVLSDKKKISNKMASTRMCNSIMNNKECPHGDNCRFAHSEDELVIRECLFGNQCRFVSISKIGIYCNKSKTSKKCMFQHPSESASNYSMRVGLPLQKNKEDEKQVFQTMEPQKVWIPKALKPENQERNPFVMYSDTEIIINVSRDSVIEEVQRILDSGVKRNVKIIL